MYLVFTRMPGESYRRVPLVEFMHFVFTRMPGTSYRRMYLWWSLCTLYLHARQVGLRVAVGDSEVSVVVLVLCLGTRQLDQIS